MKKYEFTGETKEAGGVILKQIRAVRNFEDVYAGDVGGWIEREENLSHNGNAWVSGNAYVSGGAWVYGNAHVSGNAYVYGGARVSGNACVSGGARVYGDAHVSGNAYVYGGARVYGNAWIYGSVHVYGDAWVHGNAWICGSAHVYGGEWEKSPCYIQGTRWPISISSPDTVWCGCQNHTWQGWHDHYKEISARHGADDVLEEYIRYFNLLCEMYGHEDCKIEGSEGLAYHRKTEEE